MKWRNKILMLGAGLLMAGLLSSCMTEQQQEQAQQKAQCLEAGGTWGRGGILALEQCFPHYSDAGKSCKRESDCQGMCMADTRSCAASFSYGCLSYLNNEGVAEEMCID